MVNRPAGLRGQLEELGVSQGVWEVSQGEKRRNKETKKRRLRSPQCGIIGGLDILIARL